MKLKSSVRQRKMDPVCSFPDKEAAGCSRTDTVHSFTYKETQDFRITRELHPVPNSWTNPVLSSTMKKNANATDNYCSRTDPTVSSISDNETGQFQITREISPASRKHIKVCSSSYKEFVVLRQRMENWVSNLANKETDEFNVITDNPQPPTSKKRTMASKTGN